MPGVLFLKVKMWLRKVRRDKALMVDIFSRGLFPAVFLVFNLFYYMNLYGGKGLSLNIFLKLYSSQRIA